MVTGRLDWTCYVYGLCLPLQTYLLTDKWVTVRKHLRTSLGTPLCILFRFFLTYCHFLMLLEVCTVHGTLLTEGSASTSALDSCTVTATGWKQLRLKDVELSH